jgi:hypothetical protein
MEGKWALEKAMKRRESLLISKKYIKIIYFCYEKEFFYNNTLK